MDHKITFFGWLDMERICRQQITDDELELLFSTYWSLIDKLSDLVDSDELIDSMDSSVNQVFDVDAIKKSVKGSHMTARRAVCELVARRLSNSIGNGFYTNYNELVPEFVYDWLTDSAKWGYVEFTNED